MIPRCRACGACPSEVPVFVQKAQAHNGDETKDLKVSPQTFAYGSGSDYDPLTNTFICPTCQEAQNE